jgi:hypothetical protein
MPASVSSSKPFPLMRHSRLAARISSPEASSNESRWRVHSPDTRS